MASVSQSLLDSDRLAAERAIRRQTTTEALIPASTNRA
jgi:hypothetical protein